MYPESELYREISYLAFYFHWTADQIMGLPHEERRRFCRELTNINRQLSNEPDNIFSV